jgi:hypothetical protein
MKIKINEREYEVPFDPNVITLDQYIAYYDKYGKDLDEELDKLRETKYDFEEDKYIAIDNHLDKEAISWFSFWTKVDLFEVKDMKSIIQLLTQYKVMKNLFHNEERESEEKLYEDIQWHGETWRIQDWKINPSNEMSFNEIITSKEIMRQIRKFGKGRWIALKYLCVVFLRKQNEKFIDQLVWENSERMNEIGSLPLSYALRVGFFLRNCVITLTRSFQYFHQTESLQSLS